MSMTSLPIILYGAGGHGKVLADALEGSAAYQMIGFIDDVRTGEHVGYPILGGREILEELRSKGVHCIVSIGDCADRAKIQGMMERKGFPIATVLHSTATIARSAQLGSGCSILAHAVIGPDVVMGKGCIVNTGASVDHDCIMDAYVHVAPGAHIAGGVRIGQQTFVGIGSSVRELCHIGSFAVIGAGAAVVSDFGDHVVALGVPAIARAVS